MKKFFTILALLASFSLFAACEEQQSSFTIPDPADEKPFEVTTKFYRPETKKFPVIFILPPIVGETVLDRRLGERFCQNGMAAYILNVVKVIPADEEVANLKIHDHSYVRALRGLRALKQELLRDPYVSGEFGILGMSLGGMLAAYISGVEGDFKASVIIVGAGNVAGVLSHSDQELVRAQREARQNRYGLKSREDYEWYLRSFITLDPLETIGNAPAKSVYLFIASSDTTVPTRFQRELRDRANAPLVFEMRGGHLEGIVKAGTLHAGKITGFFEMRLFP